MTDKERLEEIKQTINHPNYTEHNGQEEIYFMVSDNDFNWLIEQAERAQELERQASRHKERIIQCALRKEQQKQTLSRNNRALDGEE